jgi:hypothetical protein
MPQCGPSAGAHPLLPYRLQIWSPPGLHTTVRTSFVPHACRIHTEAFHPEWLKQNEQNRKLGLQAAPPIPDECEDLSNSCADWAASGKRPAMQSLWRALSLERSIHACDSWSKRLCTLRDPGECESNSSFMTGDHFSLGQCRRSCGACEVCWREDRACRDRNRARSGYLVTLEGSD